MAEQTEWKPEKIISWEDIKDFEVPYWLKQWKLIPWIHYPESSQESNIYVWNVTYTTTWVKTVSWIWFTPKYIDIKASLNSGAISDGYYYNGWVYCRYYFTWWGAGDASWNIWYSSYLENSWNATFTTTITPTSDWFTINVFMVAWWAITIMYTCFG